MADNLTSRLSCQVQTDDFNLGECHQWLQQGAQSCGAIVTFTGIVREMQQNDAIKALYLEHYPGMTEAALQQIGEQAMQRWSLGKVRIIHRVGTLLANQQIVLVGVSSGHRQQAFEACQYIMDILKTSAPFWKKEIFAHSEQWVSAKASDQQASLRWLTNKPD